MYITAIGYIWRDIIFCLEKGIHTCCACMVVAYTTTCTYTLHTRDAYFPFPLFSPIMVVLPTLLFCHHVLYVCLLCVWVWQRERVTCMLTLINTEALRPSNIITNTTNIVDVISYPHKFVVVFALPSLLHILIYTCYCYFLLSTGHLADWSHAQPF